MAATGRTDTPGACGGVWVFETAKLMRRAWAEFIRAGERTAPDERPNVCLQLICRVAESHALQCGADHV